MGLFNIERSEMCACGWTCTTDACARPLVYTAAVVALPRSEATLRRVMPPLEPTFRSLSCSCCDGPRWSEIRIMQDHRECQDEKEKLGQWGRPAHAWMGEKRMVSAGRGARYGAMMRFCLHTIRVLESCRVSRQILGPARQPNFGIP